MDQFKLVFTGAILDGYALDQVRADFGCRFGADPALLDRLFSGREVVIRKSMPHDRAYALAETLRGIGMTIRLEPIGPAIDTSHLALVVEEGDEERDSPEETESPQATDGMECPKCGEEQPKAEQCAACGIYIRKFLEMQQQRDEPAVEPPSRKAAVARLSGPRLSRKDAFLSSWRTVGPIVAVLLIGWKWIDRMVPDPFTEQEIRAYYEESCLELEFCLERVNNQWTGCFAQADYSRYEEAIASHRERELDELFDRLDGCLVDDDGEPLFYDDYGF